MLIQWFPGHMAKTKRLIIEHLKMVDVAVELLDARIPVSSANPMVEQLIQGKNHLVILNKADLADPEVTEQWVSFYKGKGIRVIPVSSTSNKDRKKLLAAIKETAAPALEKWKRRGIRNRSARIMILGIPNVGKSTLINRLAGTAATRTANTPGHTRGKQWVRLAQGLDLLDTPGVLWPKFDDQVAVSYTHLMIEPVTTWVVDTGRCSIVAVKIVIAEFKSAARPLTGCIRKILFPTVRMMFHPPTLVPALIASAQATLTYTGTSSAPMNPPDSKARVMMPIDFCASLEP